MPTPPSPSMNPTAARRSARHRSHAPRRSASSCSRPANGARRDSAPFAARPRPRAPSTRVRSAPGPPGPASPRRVRCRPRGRGARQRHRRASMPPRGRRRGRAPSSCGAPPPPTPRRGAAPAASHSAARSSCPRRAASVELLRQRLDRAGAPVEPLGGEPVLELRRVGDGEALQEVPRDELCRLLPVAGGGCSSRRSTSSITVPFGEGCAWRRHRRPSPSHRRSAPGDADRLAQGVPRTPPARGGRPRGGR